MLDDHTDTEEAKDMEQSRDGNVRRFALGLTIVLLAVPLAGCIGDSGGALDPASSGEEGPREETTIDVDRQTGFGTGAGVCTPAGQVGVNACSGSDLLLEATPDGTVEAADLDLVWEAENPLMEELGMTLAWDCNEGDGCRTEWASGTSPVELTVDGIGEEGKLFVLVWTPSPGTEQVYLDYKTSQEVEVTGTFTSLVPV